MKILLLILTAVSALKKKKTSISFSEANEKCYLSFHYTGDTSYLFVNGKEIYKFKVDNKNFNFPIQFCLESISYKTHAIDSRQVSLKGNGYDFSAEYNGINKSNILNIVKYLMVKNNI